MLSNADITELVGFRRALHRAPELSGQEFETAAKVVSFLKDTNPDRVITGLGGAGLAVVYNGADDGPTVMVRCELDALPIEELGTVDHKSQRSGIAHLCGHDGHMAMVCGLGRLLGRARPKTGRVVLLFQPAEETGQGAADVLADPAFGKIMPDIAISLHNLPDLPLGHVAICDGPANCASRGVRIDLVGKTAHASMPETGISPVLAISNLMPKLIALSRGKTLVDGFRLITVTHANIGQPTFGISPAQATVFATLRCLTNADMATLCNDAQELIENISQEENLTYSTEYHDVFDACTNDTEVAEMIRHASVQEDVPLITNTQPMRWSEDFGRFGTVAKSAMFVLGAGENQPQLHNPDYDFPDDLIPIGTRVFHRVVRDLLG